jgi:leucyl aminopeptidase
MEFSTKVATAEAIKADCAVVGLYPDGMTGAAKRIDRASGGAVTAAIASGDATGKKGNCVLLRNVAAIASPRVLLVGLGAADECNDKAYVEAIQLALRHAGAGVKRLAVAAGWKVQGRDACWQARALALAARETAFRTDELKSKKDVAAGIEEIVWLLDARNAQVDLGLRQGAAIANGTELTKRLGNLPSNVCTPTYLGEQARRLASDWKLGVEVHGRKAIEKLKMGSFLSVTRGTAEAPRLIVLKYQGAAESQAPVVLVGKGITFDSGGISLKPGALMDEMKYDMCGAGTVLGTLRAVAELKLAINVVGVIVACENLPSGTASKPGDIVTSMSGQTIEILNTDAEGRLILCDALTYAERFKPAAVIDIATLTGACVVALGEVNSGLFSTDDTLASDLLAASKAALDPAWRMPVEEDYQDQLKSNFADMANIGTPGKAGSVVAACFLARFTKAYKWAHLDVAGTAWKSGAAKGATGRPVPLLTHYLMRRAKQV